MRKNFYKYHLNQLQLTLKCANVNHFFFECGKSLYDNCLHYKHFNDLNLHGYASNRKDILQSVSYSFLTLLSIFVISVNASSFCVKAAKSNFIYNKHVLIKAFSRGFEVNFSKNYNFCSTLVISSVLVGSIF